MKIYPIPAGDDLYFESGISEGGSIAIHSVAGVKELESPYSDHLDVSNLAPGVYFLVIRDSGGFVVSHRKMIKI